MEADVGKQCSGRWVRFALALLVALTLATVTPAVAACPGCPTAVQARLEVWHRDLFFNLLVAALPFLIIGSICVRYEEADRRDANAKGSG